LTQLTRPCPTMLGQMSPTILTFFWWVGLTHVHPIFYMVMAQPWILLQGEEKATGGRGLIHDQEAELMAQEALVWEMVANVSCGKRDKEFTEVRERKKQWLFQAWGVVDWRRVVDLVANKLEWWGERNNRKMIETGGKGWFFFNFCTTPDFLDARTMKSTPIYREWKRAILYSLGKTFSHWFGSKRSQSLVQSRLPELKAVKFDG